MTSTGSRLFNVKRNVNGNPNLASAVGYSLHTASRDVNNMDVSSIVVAGSKPRARSSFYIPLPSHIIYFSGICEGSHTPLKDLLTMGIFFIMGFNTFILEMVSRDK